ncbi:MAG: alpha/beta fold hydrolase [Proteobacteria bacterium]|nr:alpha/beta fold hydrolase [Pseudomonadota bacterium]
MSQTQLSFHQFLTSPDNIHIRYALYGTTKVTHHLILFFLGRGEWIEKYTSIYQRLYDELGSTVVILDHLGQGGSGGIPSHIDSYDEYVSTITQLIRNKFRTHSYSIIAHSMGGLIAIYGTLKQEFSPKRLILSSPLAGLPQKPIPRVIAKPLSKFFTESGLAQLSTFIKTESSYRFTKNRLTTDKEKYLIARDNPYPIPAPTMGWVAATFAACEIIHYDRFLMNLTVPLLVFYGSDELIVSKSSIVRWTKLARKLSSSTINLVCMQHAKHEIFFESEKILQDALDQTIEFLVHDYRKIKSKRSTTKSP